MANTTEHIVHISGDMLASNEDMLVIPVNCVGVAGCGLAKLCLQKYPKWGRGYRLACARGTLAIGKLVVHTMGDGKAILSFPTKTHWNVLSRLHYIEDGLKALLESDGAWQHASYTVAFPLLGCGAGGLEEKHVIPLMEHYLEKLPASSHVYHYI